MIAFLFQRDFLRFFIDDISAKNWEATAANWLIVATVVAVLAAGFVFGYKGLRKRTADLERKKIWTRGQTWVLILIGVFPIVGILLLVWWMTRDFTNYVQIGGLAKGILFAWVVYLVFMVIGHILGPWRRELV